MSTPDHRTRVAAVRRQKMRERLVVSALGVFADTGLNGTVIDDVIRAAGVSRGTFYKYFKTHEALVDAVSADIGDHLMKLVVPVGLAHSDPAVRVACGVRLCLQAGQMVPNLALFVAKAEWRQSAPDGLAFVYLSRDIQSGMDSGRFDVPSLRVGLDLVFGPVMSAMFALTQETVPATYAQDLAAAILQGLGISKAQARKIAQLPLPPMMSEPKTPP